MKRRMKKITALCMAAAMTVSLAACGGGSSESSKGADASSSAAASGGSSDEPVTLTIWNTEVLQPGVQTNEIAKEIEKRFGIKMDVVQGDAQKFSILVAGGDLPDIIYTNPAQQNTASNNLITSGQLLAMDDLIEQYGENVKKNFPDRLKYSKQFASNGEDKVYYLPVRAYEADEEHPNISYSIENIGLMTRWDIYQAIGCPEIQTTDDYLDVLKQMQDYAREKDLADGKQIYAISGWSDWGLWPWWLSNAREMGYMDLANDTIFNYDTQSVEGLYTSEAFWESLKFYNKAYNMGILDPEAFTMKNDQYWEKCKNGQVLMAYASWQTENINRSFVSDGHEGWSFQKLPYDGYEYISGIVSTNAPLGGGIEYATAITKNCKNPEKAMQLIDFFNSEEGARLIYSGIEGTHWTDNDGKPQPTDEFIEKSKSDSNYKDNVGVNLYNKLCAFMDIQVLSDGYPADLMKSDEQKAANISDQDKSYCDYYAQQEGGDYQYPGQVLYDMWQKGKVKTITDYYLYPTLVQSPSEETLNIIAQCDQYMNVQGVNAIMTGTEDEFNACKEETLKGLENKNYEQAKTEIADLYAKAEKEADAFGMK
ncbi:MAG: extracellular solute-binding protein [Lachnospiraceae bacterium]|nr:extracellular solute-binding protein [Lachnospiraceae bacterium]